MNFVPTSTMFPAPDSNNSCSGNRFSVPYSDQSLLYSKLLDDIHIDSDYHNPYSPFSFLDQFHAHSPFFNSSDDHHEQQPLKFQDSPLVLPHHEEQQPVVTTAYQEIIMAAAGNNSASTGVYCTSEKFHHNGYAGEPTTGVSRTNASVGPVQHDAARKNGILLKKDRHSKINTARGPRDRRMRLSLDIAQRFFGLQDMLGFDKASKTVEWLLCKSQSEVNKVVSQSKNSDANTVKSDSFGASDCCEEVSEVDNRDDLSQSGAMDAYKENKKSKSKEKKSGKASVSSRKDRFNHLVAKESREKARARARERTKEKMMICTSQSHTKQQDNNVHYFSNMEQNMLTQVRKQDFLNLGPDTYSYVDQGHMMTDQDESLANTSFWNPSSTNIFNHLQKQSNETSQQLQFGDLHSYARPWETYH